MTTADEHYDNDYQLDCGRWVTVQECYISTSMLGYLAGSPENLRVIRRVIECLPERIRNQFGQDTDREIYIVAKDDPAIRSENIRVSPKHKGDFFYIKPLPEGSYLPTFVFMVYLVSSESISDPESHGSKLIVCWLSNDITTSLPELLKRETRAIEWNKYAVDFCY